MSHHLRSCLLAIVLTVAVTALSPGRAGARAAQHEDSPRNRPGTTEARRADAPRPVSLPAKGELAARVALQEVGTAYRWGGESPATGFDCSGLVRWAYGQVGVVLPHSSYALHDVGRPVSESRLAPGDVLFFDGLGHVGIYIGRGRMVHAPQTGRNVEVVRLDGLRYGLRLVDARRVVAG
jgi:cell wall-associated NlpC family hydrolase